MKYSTTSILTIVLLTSLGSIHAGGSEFPKGSSGPSVRVRTKQFTEQPVSQTPTKGTKVPEKTKVLPVPTKHGEPKKVAWPPTTTTTTSTTPLPKPTSTISPTGKPAPTSSVGPPLGQREPQPPSFQLFQQQQQSSTPSTPPTVTSTSTLPVTESLRGKVTAMKKSFEEPKSTGPVPSKISTGATKPTPSDIFISKRRLEIQSEIEIIQQEIHHIREERASFKEYMQQLAQHEREIIQRLEKDKAESLRGLERAKELDKQLEEFEAEHHKQLEKLEKEYHQRVDPLQKESRELWNKHLDCEEILKQAKMYAGAPHQKDEDRLKEIDQELHEREEELQDLEEGLYELGA